MLTTAAAGWAAKIGKAIGAGSARVLSAYYAADWLQAASARALPPGSAEVRAVTQMQRRWEVKLGTSPRRSRISWWSVEMKRGTDIPSSAAISSRIPQNTLSRRRLVLWPLSLIDRVSKA
jgi:hypothetical protein